MSDRIGNLAAGGERAAAPADLMGRELLGTYETVEATLANVDRHRREIDSLVAGAAGIVLLGTGMSLAVANAAAPALRRARGSAGGREWLVVRESTAAALDGDDGMAWSADQLVMAISKSGTSPESVAAVRRAAEAGARVIAITAMPDSPFAVAASLVIETPIGDEQGAATRSATTGLTAALSVGGALRSDTASRQALGDLLRATEPDWPATDPAGAALAAAERTWLTGFGSGIGLAQAAAILWHEKAHRPAGFGSVSEFRHGPVEAARRGDALVVIDPDPPLPARGAYLATLRADAAALGLAIVWLSPAPPEDTFGLRLAGAPGPIATIEALVRLQQLARATALAGNTYRDDFGILRNIVQPVTGL